MKGDTTMQRMKGRVIARLPMEAVLAMRSKGGAQSSPKGKKGYNRNAEKTRMRKEFSHV
jgi:hypothetical protein